MSRPFTHDEMRKFMGICGQQMADRTEELFLQSYISVHPCLSVVTTNKGENSMNMTETAVKLEQAKWLLSKAHNLIKEVDGEACARLPYVDPCTEEGQSFDRFARSLCVCVKHMDTALERLPGEEWCKRLGEEQSAESKAQSAMPHAPCARPFDWFRNSFAG